MRVFFRNTPRSFALVSNDYALILQAVSPSECLIDFQRASHSSLEGYTEIVSQLFHGLIGILSTKNQLYFAVITEQLQVGSPRPSEAVYKIRDLEFYCLSSSDYDSLVTNRSRSENAAQRYEIEHPCSKIKKVFTKGFHYSRDFDLTNVLQERGLAQRDYHQMFNNYEKKYLWNSTLIRELLAFRNRITQDERDAFDRSEFLTFLVRGFVKTFNVSLDGDDDSLITLISRISSAKLSGPFGIGGVDEEGHVSNFIETELLVYNKNHYFSYSQLRGNVPLFYDVENPFLQNKKISFPRTSEVNEMSFDKHFGSITASHGQVYVVNALKNKAGEEELSNRYRYLVKKKGLPLIDADITRDTLKKSPHKLIYLLKEAILEIGAFCYDIKQKVYIGKQLGIFRINSLNSIEKPGLIEKVISKEVMDISLREMGLLLSSDLLVKHNLLWDENNSALLQIYEKSIRRKDKKLYVGVASNDIRLIDPIHDFICEELLKRKSEYSSKKTIRLFTGTFNVNAETTDEDLSSWIFPHQDEVYDLAVIGLEEVVELTTSQMLNTSSLQKKKWEYKLKKTLGQRNRYSLVSSEQLGGIALMIFIREDQIDQIKEVESSLKKTGMAGMSANKGGIGSSILYSSTRLCFICSHLAAGMENVEQRHIDYKTIAQSMRFGGKRTVKDHDAVIWFGDFNYRIDLNNEQVRDAIQRKQYTVLFEHDQLNKQMISGESFPYFNEMEIKFPPTYKFNKGTSHYDTSEKFRIPAWTDRILSKSHEGTLMQLSYGDAPDIKFSDHRPVYATFDATVVVIDEKKQDRLTKELYEKRKLQLLGQPLTIGNGGIGDHQQQQLQQQQQQQHQPHQHQQPQQQQQQLTPTLVSHTSKAHGLPPPSTDRVKWWLDGGVKVTVPSSEGKTKVNPHREINPFIDSDIPEFII